MYELTARTIGLLCNLKTSGSSSLFTALVLEIYFAKKVKAYFFFLNVVASNFLPRFEDWRWEFFVQIQEVTSRVPKLLIGNLRKILFSAKRAVLSWQFLPLEFLHEKQRKVGRKYSDMYLYANRFCVTELVLTHLLRKYKCSNSIWLNAFVVFIS